MSDINREKITYDLLFDAIIDKNEEMIKKYAYCLYDETDDKPLVTALLYIIDNITHVDKTHKDIIKASKLNRTDIKIEDNRENFINIILKRNYFETAYNMITTLENKEEIKYREAFILLLKEVIAKSLEFKNYTLNLVFTKNFDLLYKKLSDETDTRNITKKQKLLLYLVSVYKNMNENGVILEEDDKDADRLDTLIYSNRFETALKIVSENAKREKKARYNRALLILLSEIVRLKNELIEKNGKHVDIQEIENLASREDVFANYEDMIKEAKMDENSAALFKLYVAKIAYLSKKTILGDKLLKEVSKLKNKTSDTKTLLNETQNKKKVYINSAKFN